MGPNTVHGRRILLAEDQLGVREAIKLLLHVDQHVVTEAKNGREAFDLFAHNRFDLVITDFDMPGMQGDELAIRIKEMSPSQPIVMITAFAEELEHSNNPVDAVLAKPFSFQDLRSTIARLAPSTADCLAPENPPAT